MELNFQRPLIVFMIGILSLSLGCQNTKPLLGNDVSVLILLVDALRSDHVGCYGYPKNTTPNIDKACKKGILFQNAITTSAWTQPVIASLFTGLNPIQHGVMRWPRKKRGQHQITVFPESNLTLSEILKNSGFSTSAFVANPYLEGMVGFEQGFDFYSVGEKTANEINNEFLEWLSLQKPERFFTYLHYMEPHWPYNKGFQFLDQFGGNPKNFDLELIDWIKLRKRMDEKPESFSMDEIKEIISLYDSSIRAVDEAIGSLLRELEHLDRNKNLLVIIVADHGEEFGEHGRFGHVKTLFDSLLKIPLIFFFPEEWNSGTRIIQQVRLVDIFPTLLESLGIPLQEKILGSSLMELMTNEGVDIDFPPYAFSEFMWSDTYLRQSIRTQEFKLVRTLNRLSGSELVGKDVPPAYLSKFIDTQEPKQFKTTRALYDIRNDPQEQFNLFRLSEPPSVGKKLELILDEWLRKNAEKFDSMEPRTLEIRGEMIERLKNLGYIQ